ncbi:NAD(P)/FAD-dependent oxidoreductase [Thermincola ferriacetica]
MKYVLIGNSAAAIGAVEGIRKVDKKGTITILSDEPYHTYSRPLISYYLADKVTEDQMRYRPEDFYALHDVQFLGGRKALAVKTGEKTVVTAEGDIPYDKLLIATGSKPIVPPVPGLDREGVYTFIKFDDVKKIKEVAAPGKKAVVIGAGLIGMKAAEALVQCGVETTVLDLSDRILSSILDTRAAEMVKAHAETKGVAFKLNNTVVEVRGDNKVSSVLLKDNNELPCDIVIVAIGVTPNLDVIKESDIKYNRGILVDEKMQTSVPDVYAAGDVSEGYDLLYGGQRVLPILPNAYMQGEIAGQAMAGAEVQFGGGFAFNAIGLFGLPINTAGIVNPEGSEYEIMVDESSQDKCYRKIVLKNDRVVGFILLNSIDRSGILTGLIREQADVKAFKQDLIRQDFGYIHFAPDVRKAKLTGGKAGD